VLERICPETITEATEMNIPTPLYALAAVLTLAGALEGCATLGKCDSASCRDDAAITSQVQDRLNQSPVFGSPNSIRVQTVDHVVYLNGEADGSLEKRTAASEVQQVAGVTQVVNNIAVVNK
jgi:osmotically-inducible protein OsmY